MTLNSGTIPSIFSIRNVIFESEITCPVSSRGAFISAVASFRPMELMYSTPVSTHYLSKKLYTPQAKVDGWCASQATAGCLCTYVSFGRRRQ